jgi:catechol 2,3-dioxygenase-like lactoylglutathione lyase family enzyme
MDATLWNIGIKVDDVCAEVDFYAALGGRLLLHEVLPMSHGGAEYALLEFGGTRLFLTTKPIFEDRLASPPPPGLTHAVFEVRDVDGEVERLTARGAELLIPPLDISAGFGARRIAFLRSPGGMVFEVMRITG